MHRYLAYAASCMLLALSIALCAIWPLWGWGVAAFAILALLGTWDLVQTRSTLRRNYPILAHFRYGLESVGPEMRQYFLQSVSRRRRSRASSVPWSTSGPGT
ncbi:Conserved hypothetical membrane protein [Xanthomonas translucens pv. translucens DSM 18974]|uniref:Conserved hypothetical membrane protein n=1 Tax=Xanthomonas translucens pv. translucens DSM 18974 TaxID=1261556 RepID=A0A1C3TN37_XANCT|nr:hypothetical protein BN444_00095 [Xanthomonas translucens pv. translucens DSM 18974]SCB04602.1 Conserved hypothetical membrane protein [Xanthomonas translucens pv. translucens DSM 18974]